MNDFNKLTKILERTGCRHPKDPFTILRPSHPYCSLLIKSRKIESKIDFSKDPIKSEKYFQQQKKIDKRLKNEKNKLNIY